MDEKTHRGLLGRRRGGGANEARMHATFAYLGRSSRAGDRLGTGVLINRVGLARQLNVCCTLNSDGKADIAGGPSRANGLNRSRGRACCGDTVSMIAREEVLS